MTLPRLLFYAYLLSGAARLSLNYALHEAYNRHDLSLAIFTQYATHYLASLAVLPATALAAVFDLTFVLWPHPLVAPMLLDLLTVHNRGCS